jgi:hypothetical protein
VEPTLEGIFVEGEQGDVIGDHMDSNGEDSEVDESVQIFDLERLDFDDEDGIEDALE